MRYELDAMVEKVEVFEGRREFVPATTLMDPAYLAEIPGKPILLDGEEVGRYVAARWDSGRRVMVTAFETRKPLPDGMAPALCFDAEIEQRAGTWGGIRYEAVQVRRRNVTYGAVVFLGSPART